MAAVSAPIITARGPLDHLGIVAGEDKLENDNGRQRLLESDPGAAWARMQKTLSTEKLLRNISSIIFAS